MSQTLGAGEPTPKEEIDARIAGLRRLMAESGIDFCVILQHVDLFYFTGSTQKATLVVTRRRGAALFRPEERRAARRTETPLPVIEAQKRQPHGGDAQGERRPQGQGRHGVRRRPRGGLSDGSQDSRASTISRTYRASSRSCRIVKSPFEIEQCAGRARSATPSSPHAPRRHQGGCEGGRYRCGLGGRGQAARPSGVPRMRGLNQEMMNLYVTSGYSGTIASAGDVPVAGLGVTPAVAQGSSLQDGGEGHPGDGRLRRRIQRLHHRRDKVLRGGTAGRDVPEALRCGAGDRGGHPELSEKRA